MISKITGPIQNFLKNSKQYATLVVVAAGLYPFFQYYNNNLAIAASWQQLLFIAGICIVLPLVLRFIWSVCYKMKLFKPMRPYGLSILNSVMFFGLIGFLVLSLNRKMLLLLLIIAFVLGFVIAKHLKKIVAIQMLLAVISMIGLVPKLMFEMQQDNSTWAKLSPEELNTTFVKTPNIFVIQPDGYVNFSEINKEPYRYDNSVFEAWLGLEGFTNYSNFRSNYYSTYTSNASMFTMQHHYYSNTDKATLKTHGANNAIIGENNNVLNILKANNYKSHLITDNSYFLIDREPMFFDYCNIKPSQTSFYKSGVLHDVDMLSDFKTVLDTLSKSKNFFFIEKTVPGHISHRKDISEGKVIERTKYLDKLEIANDWLKSIVSQINQFDEQALIIIVADHGGYVGLDYTLESIERKQNNLEIKSAFSSMLSIKWPKDVDSEDLMYKSNVNLFRYIFYTLSKNEDLLINSVANSSFLPLKESGSANYYEYIDDNGRFVFNNLTD
ncbi:MULTISPECIES: hypothetical protein [Winogradskyella]|uniref:Sulfatase N-terminal domain-containing protein n=1 Tax=Winogradskyella damuponensis TaxID=943939 RepID=A0ABP8D0Q0_9FLAO